LRFFPVSALPPNTRTVFDLISCVCHLRRLFLLDISHPVCLKLLPRLGLDVRWAVVLSSQKSTFQLGTLRLEEAFDRVTKPFAHLVGSQCIRTPYLKYPSTSSGSRVCVHPNL
jgi:hypothetical protein